MIRRLYCTGDAELSTPDSNTNYGGSHIVQGTDNDFGVVRFDLPPDLLNYDIVSAKLWIFYRYMANATYMRYYKILDSWIEGNGNPYRAYTNTIPGAITYNNCPPLHSVNWSNNKY